MITQRPSFRSTLRVLRVSAVNNTSTAETPRARSGGAQRSHGRLDGAAHVAESGRLARHGRSRLFQTKLINIRAHPLHPCRSVFYSAIHTPLRRTIGPDTTIQRLQRNPQRYTTRRFSLLTPHSSPLTPPAAPAPATFAPCAMPGTAPLAAQQRRPLPPPAQTVRRSTRRAASSRTSGG